MMNAQPTLRLCHTGMDSRSLYAFEIFLSRVGPGACQITEEESADAAFIDIDNDLGRYLLEGHRARFPSRPLIVSAQTPAPDNNDPLTIEVTKPVGLAAFFAALEQVRRLLPTAAADSAGEACVGTDLGRGDTAEDANLPEVDEIPDEMPMEVLFDRGARPAADPVCLLRQLEERMSTFYVGSMPDVDLDDANVRAAVFYAPEQFLQGEIARALAHAREIRRPVRLDDASGAALILDPLEGHAYPLRSNNALRALAQLPTRGMIHMTRLDAHDGTRLARAERRSLEALEWDVALWASRGRLPRGTHLDHPVRLHAWPNLTRLAVPPEAMRIAGLWSRGNVSLRDTVRVLGVPQRYVFAFYSACHALGLAELIATPAALAAARLGSHIAPAGDAAQATPPLRGLFKRILGKLLGARLGETSPG